MPESEKLNRSGINHVYYNKSRPPEHGVAISKGKRGKSIASRSPAAIAKFIDTMTGRPSKLKGTKRQPLSDAHKSNLSKSKRGKPLPTKGIPKATVQCPHCGKVGGEAAMARWHFDNCKFIRN